MINLTVRDLTLPSANCQEFTTVAINVDDPFDCYTPANGCEGAGVTWCRPRRGLGLGRQLRHFVQVDDPADVSVPDCTKT
ncbi:MAG: hypothetical protein U0U46_11490 [Saprospiraceae bacterium]